MKKVLFCLFIVFSIVEVFAQNISLDQAVQSSAKTIETRLPQSAKAAVLAFSSSSQAFSDYIIDELATAISISSKIQIIDRQHTDAIRKELNIQMSGDVSDNEVRRVGHQLGAQYVITGSLVDIGNAYRFRVAAINVESAVREGSSSLNININDPQVVFLITGQRAVENITTNPTNSGNTGVSVYYGTWIARGTRDGNQTTWTAVIDANRITLRSSAGGYAVISNPKWTAVNNSDPKTLRDFPRGFQIDGAVTEIDSWGRMWFRPIYLFIHRNNMNRIHVYQSPNDNSEIQRDIPWITAGFDKVN